MESARDAKDRWSREPRKIGRNTKGGGSFDNGKKADQLVVTRPDERQMEREVQKNRAMEAALTALGVFCT